MAQGCIDVCSGGHTTSAVHVLTDCDMPPEQGKMSLQRSLRPFVGVQANLWVNTFLGNLTLQAAWRCLASKHTVSQKISNMQERRIFQGWLEIDDLRCTTYRRHPQAPVSSCRLSHAPLRCSTWLVSATPSLRSAAEVPSRSYTPRSTRSWKVAGRLPDVGKLATSSASETTSSCQCYCAIVWPVIASQAEPALM